MPLDKSPGCVHRARIAAVLTLILLGISCQPRTAPPDPADLIAAADLGSFAEVNKLLVQLCDQPDSRELVLLVEGIVSLRNGNIDAALTLLAKVDQEGPLRHHVMQFAGEALHKAGRLGEAARILTVLVTESPDQAEGHRWLAATWYDLGAFNAAIEELDALIRLRADDFRPHHLLAIMYSDFEQHAEATDHLQRALELAPTDHAAVTEMRLLLADNLAAERHYDQALEILKQTLESTRSLQILAECQLATGNPEAAIQTVQKARQLGDNSPAICLVEADLQDQQGNAEAALQTLQRGLADSPTSAELLYRCGLVEKQLGRDQESEQTLERWQHFRDLSTQLTQLNLKAIEEPLNSEVREQLAEICDELQKSELAEMWRQAAASAKRGSQIDIRP